MKLKQKLMAAILTVMMLTSYIAILTDAVIAVGVNLGEQSSKTNHTNVEFNSYFEGEEHSKTFEIGKEAKLYLKLKVSNTGYLKNGVVQFSNANFEVNSNNLKNDKIQSSSNNTLNLKQINNGEEVIIEVPVNMLTAEKVDKDFFNEVTTTKFTGTYIDENGKERPIEKEVSNQLNWKGTAQAEVTGEVTKYLPYETENEKGLLVQTKVKANIKENQLPVAKTKIEVSIPEIALTEGVAELERVTVIANTTEGTNGKGSYEFCEENYHYNSETNKVEIEVENKAENGQISWKKKAVDEYLINFIYTGEEVYTQAQKQLEKASKTMKTEEEKKAGLTNENAITGEINVHLQVEAFNSEKTDLEKSAKVEYSIEKAKGELVDNKFSTVKELSKGYIYSNFAKSEKQAKTDTDYTENYMIQIHDKTLVNNIELKTATQKYLDEEENEYPSNINSKSVKISELVFNKMLGKEGKIEITNVAGEKLAEITSKSEKDSNGNYIANISEANANEIILKLTNPITEGNIEITVEKSILGNQDYTKEQMQEFKSILVETKTQDAKISLTEPVSKAQISIGTQNLSTIVENKDVEIRVVLDTSNNKNALYKNPTFQIVLPENIEKLAIKSTDLLLDDELKIKETKVVEQNGRKVILLTLKGTQTKYMDNENSNQENVISKGANIVIKTDITFKRLTPSANSNIYLYYTNENTDLFENYYQSPKAKARTASNTTPMGLATTPVKVVAPNGVVTESHMSGFKGSETITNATNETQTQNIDAHTPAKEVNIGGTIVNNYDNSIDSVYILGRIPFSGNKEIDTTKDMGSNFTMAMKNKITTSGIDSSNVTIYYSTNGEATKDLSDTNNGWVEEPSNIAEVKSYLIAISGEVAKATQFNFDYQTELPASLSYSKQAYTSYKVYYNNNMPEAPLGETKVSGIIGLTTGQGPELQVSVKANETTVREGQIVKMTATVKNVGGLDAQNAKLHITAPDGTVHTEIETGYHNYTDSQDKEKEITLGNIKAGQTITVDYELKIQKGTKTVEVIDEEESETSVEKKHTEIKNEYPGDKDIQNTVKVTAENMSGEISSEVCTLRILKGDLAIVNCPSLPETDTLRKGDKVTYTIQVSNISYDKDLNNVTLKIKLPDGVKVNEAYYSNSSIFLDELGNPDKKTENIVTNGNEVSINVGTLQSSIKYLEEIIANEQDPSESETQLIEDAYVCIVLEIAEFHGEHEILMEAVADGIETHHSNSKMLKAESVNLKIEQKALDSTYIKEGSEYTYHFNIENISKVTSNSNVIEMEIPDGLSIVKAEYTTASGETVTSSYTNEGKLITNIYTLGAGEKIDLAVTVKANLLPDENDKEIITKATLSAQGFQTIESNQVRAIIEYDATIHKGESIEDNPAGGDNKPGDDNDGTYKITGTAWIDENKDGQRNEQETILAGVQVILLYKSNSQIVKDEITGAEKMTTTAEDGKYEFTGLKPDEYLVLFLYDAGKYSITDYQKQGVAESINSDATSMRIILNGEQRQAGVSNTIKISDSHIRDIDIGLFVAEKFDLRLDKYISKITVTTPSSGTKVYHYNNSKLTKREIASKDVENTQLVVEYKIVATNEGQVDGYVKKIIDYLPLDAKFSSELNKDWYISDNNGAVYNTALENEKIEPGQSKEVTLVLSFNINNKNIGKMINNNAEIYESYNELGLEDIDSITANMLESEDDMSTADIMVSVATGKVVIYTTFTIAIIALLGFGIFEIKKHVLTEKKN